MKKILFLTFVSLMLLIPAFAVVDINSVARAAGDEANTIVQMHNDIQNASKGNSTACVSDSDCVAAQCCHATSVVNKAYAPDCSAIVCTADCQPDTIDCGGKVKCAAGKCKAVAASEISGQTETQINARNATSIFVKLPVSNRTRARNMTDLEEIRTEKQLELIAKFAGQTNQNAVRLAVHTLLAMEDLEGGIGKNVSAIAREFDNSVNKTAKAEEKIQKRSKIRTAFFGGDAASADEIDSEVSNNQARIQLLKQYKEQCPCSAEVKAKMQEQIQQMEQENTRLQTLAAAEKAKKGIFGFLKRNK